MKKIDDLYNRLINEKNEIRIFNENFEKDGEGILINVYKDGIEIYIKVLFQKSQRETRYKLPYAIENGYIDFENHWDYSNPITYYDKEFIKEKRFFEAVVERCMDAASRSYKAPNVYHEYNPKDEYFDPQSVADEIETKTMCDRWINISKEPFFGSFKSDIYNTIYIGKNQIDELVRDYRDPICAYYYEYSFSLGNLNLGLSLVRDHTIEKGRYPVGIEGKIEEIDIKEELKVDSDSDRTVLIIKDLDITDLLIKTDINIVKKSQTILRNVINVLDISEVKGLEFEKVYIYGKNMTEHEKYLAYSRALNHLVIIRPSEKEKTNPLFIVNPSKIEKEQKYKKMQLKNNTNSYSR